MENEKASQSTIVSASRASFLAHANLITIYSNRDEGARLAAMKGIYTEGVVELVSPAHFPSVSAHLHQALPSPIISAPPPSIH